MSHTGITVGALVIGLVLLGNELWRFWKSPGHDPKVLVPFGSSFLLGALATVCAGLLGLAVSWTISLTNAAGRAAPHGTGTTTVRHTTMGNLTAGGALVAALLAVGWVIAWRASSKEKKRKLGAGWWCGVTLTATAGVAGLLGTYLLPIVNGAGDGVLAWFNGNGHVL